MKMNGIASISRGLEDVCIYGNWIKKTVYFAKEMCKFYVKLNGEFIEVYHKANSFSTTN